MYYLIYIPFYLLSLLPLRILYLLGDGIYVLVYYVFGYRKQVVLTNLQIAFPEKSSRERERIARDFYHQFIDNFIETIKFISWDYKKFQKRFSSDLSGLEKAYGSQNGIQLIGMHNFNWEYANWGLARSTPVPFVAVYSPIKNKAFDRLMIDIRSRYGTVLIPSTGFRESYKNYVQIPHILALVADQSPGTAENAFWLPFFGRPTAFVTGPEKGARMKNASIVFGNFFKTRRGHYRLETTFVTHDSISLPEGEITRRYVKYVEECIRLRPANYLWSHRRWKKEWKPEYRRLWIGDQPPPGE